MAEPAKTPAAPQGDPATAARGSRTAVEKAVVAPDGSVRLDEPRGNITSVEIADVDLLIRFSDGRNILIPNGALDALSDKAPRIDFLDQSTSATELFKLAGKTAPVTAGNVRIITDQLDTRSTEGGEPEEHAPEQLDQPPVPSPAPALPKPGSLGLTASKGVGKGDGTGPGEVPDQIEPVQTVFPPAYRQGVQIAPLPEPEGSGSANIKGQMYAPSEWKLTNTGRADSPLASYNALYDAATDSPGPYPANPDNPVNDPALPANQAFRETINLSADGGANSLLFTSGAPSELWGTRTLRLDIGFTDLTGVVLKVGGAFSSIAFDASQATQDSVAANYWNLDLAALSAPVDSVRSIDLIVYYKLVPDGTTTLPDNIPVVVEATGTILSTARTEAQDFYLKYSEATSSSDYVTPLRTFVLPARGIGYDVELGGGNDTIQAGAGHDSIKGQAGNDALLGEAGNDTLNGGTGGDTLDGGTGTNTASYTDDASGVAVSLAAVTASEFRPLVSFTSEAGGVRIGSDASAGEAGGDLLKSIRHIVGSSGNDLLIGDASANSLAGGNGADTLEGGVGADSLNGGDGSDWASYEHAAAAVSISLDGSLTASGDAGADVLTSIENLRGSEHDDTLAGSTADNSLDGGAGTDTVTYASATQTSGAALVAGVAGISVLATGTTGEFNVTAGATNSGTDLLRHIENIIGTGGDDSLRGDAASNSLSGGGGNDTLDGGAGNVVDTLVGGDGTNTLSYASIATAGGVSVTLVVGAGTASGDGGADVFSGIRHVIGSIGNDTLIGDGEDNSLAGGSGDDSINGGAGRDTLEAGDGIDTLDGGSGGSGDSLVGSGNDFLTYASITGSGSGVSVSLLDNAVSGAAGNDTIVGFQHLTGSSRDDTLTGSIAANTIDGGDGDDLLDGGQGADSLVGGNGSDTVTYANASGGPVGISLTLVAGAATVSAGGTDAGNDTLSGIEHIVGSASNDSLVGDTVANSLSGANGDDTIDGGDGDVVDTLAGGSGVNTLSYASHTATGTGVSVNLLTMTVLGNGVVGDDVISGFRHVTGSGGDDALTGDTSANSLAGGGGNDTLIGGVGDDTLDGGGGVDTVSYATATRVDGNPLLSADTGVTILSTGLGSYTVATGSSNAGSDVLSGIEYLVGTTGTDSILGDAGANSIVGGDGNDTIDGGDGNVVDTLDGGAGTGDLLSYASLATGSGVNVSLLTSTASGGGGVDVISNFEGLIGSQYADTLTGDNGNNTIEGGGGNDSLVGNAGTDLLSFASASASVTVNLNGSVVTNPVSAVAAAALRATGLGTDTLSGFENVLMGSGNDTVYGDGASNSITGGAGDDWIDGGSGNINDTLDGGDGTDWVSYALAGGAVTVSLNAQGAAQNTGGSGGIDTLRNFENLFGSLYNDTLTGSSVGGRSSNQIFGYNGDDLITPGAGNINDTLNGGAGTDYLNYSAITGGVNLSYNGTTATGTATGTNIGTDSLAQFEQFYGTVAASGASGDAFTASGTVASLYLRFDNPGLAIATTTTGIAFDLSSGTGVNTGNTGVFGADTISGFVNVVASGGRDTLIGSDAANNIFWGRAGNDSLSGFGGNDSLYGEGDNDTIDGGDGNDWIEGGTGNDSLIGGAGTDWASYQNAGSAVTVSLASNTATGGANTDTLSGFENIYGSGYNDVLTGDAGNNSLDGAGGDDILEGGLGDDTLNGNSGSDYASYANASNGVTVSLAIGVAQNTVNAGTDTLQNIENLIGSAYNDSLTDSGANTTVNVIYGLAGNDTIVSGTAANGGADSLIGGSGDDVFYVYPYAPLATLYGRIYGGDVTANNSSNSSAIDGIVVRGTVGNVTLATLHGNAANANASRLYDIDVVDLKTDAVNSQITVTAADVRYITGSISGVADLYIVAAATDTLTGAAAGWSSSSGGSFTFNGATYTNHTIYNSGGGEQLHWLT